MDYKEVIGFTILFLSTVALWTGAAISKKDPIRWSGYVVAGAIGTVALLAAVIFEAQHFADKVGDAAYAAGCEAAAKDAAKSGE